MTGFSDKKLFSVPILLLQTAAAALAWIGTDFSPGFSEGLIAIFVFAGAAMLLFPEAAWGRIVFLAGALCIPVGTYIYAAGEDHLSACLWISLLGTASTYAVLFVILRKNKKPASEHLLRTALVFAGLFSLLCGVYSTALLPVGFGVLLCSAARYAGNTLPWITVAGLLLCDAFLLAPMCFRGIS